MNLKFVAILIISIGFGCQQTQNSKVNKKNHPSSEVTQLQDRINRIDYKRFYISPSHTNTYLLSMTDTDSSIVYFKLNIFNDIKMTRDSIIGSATLIKKDAIFNVYEKYAYTAEQYKVIDSCDVSYFIAHENENKYLKIQVSQPCGKYDPLLNEYTFIRTYLVNK